MTMTTKATTKAKTKAQWDRQASALEGSLELDCVLMDAGHRAHNAVADVLGALGEARERHREAIRVLGAGTVGTIDPADTLAGTRARALSAAGHLRRVACLLDRLAEQMA